VNQKGKADPSAALCPVGLQTFTMCRVTRNTNGCEDVMSASRSTRLDSASVGAGVSVTRNTNGCEDETHTGAPVVSETSF